MKGEKVRIIIIYFLVLVIIGLIGYLIYFIYDQNKPNKPKEIEIEETNENSEITDACTFDITLKEFNELAGDTALELCKGYNKLNISDVIIGENPIDIYAVYYNGKIKNDTTLGLYMNDIMIINGASSYDKNTITINDNLIFIQKEKNNNLVVFNIDGQNVYDLAATLDSLQIEDPVLAEMEKTNENIKPTVLTSIIDKDSYTFKQNSFTFTTTVLDTKQQGSTYIVTYNGEVFQDPVIQN